MLVRSYSEKESQLKQRTKQVSDKDILFQKVHAIFQKSTSIPNFKERLEKDNIITYERGGKLTGVYFGKRRYRLKNSLGIDMNQLQIKDKVSEREQALKTLRKRQKGRSIDRTRER